MSGRTTGRCIACVVGLAMLLGCGELGRRAVAPVDDFAAYRRYRLTRTVHSRLGAAYDYLRNHPRGRWHTEVARWFEATSEARVDAAWNDLPTLRALLEVVPAGPAARRAAERVLELELAESYRREKARAFDQRVAAIDARLLAAREGRRALVRAVSSWAAHLSRVREWGSRTHELDHRLIHAFRLTPPEGRCIDAHHCVKAMNFAYAIPEAKAQSDRVAILDVTLELVDGGVEGVTVGGPELFSRVGEALMLRPIEPTDLSARTDALVRVTAMVAFAVESAMPEERCAVAPTSPVMLHRRCDGTELLLVAATSVGEEDRLVARPVVTPADAGPPEAPTP